MQRLEIGRKIIECNEALSGWATAEKETIAQMGKHRTEKIYMNYRPTVLQQKQMSFV